jgi:plastocyanin
MKIPSLLAVAIAGFAAVLLVAAEPATPMGARVVVVDPAGAPVDDAVASLFPLDRAVTLSPPAEPVAIIQQGEEFQPYVTPVVVGTRVHFPNQDKVQHHVFSISRAKKFDLPLYRGEPKETVLFDQPGVVSLGCNIHDWMAAYVVVLATPHFAKTGSSGTAAFDGLPAGRYRLEVWHPRLRTLEVREVTLSADPSTQTMKVTLGIDRRVRRAPDSGTGSYK